jgi:multiple sugar transport system ATP-binding protein
VSDGKGAGVRLTSLGKKYGEVTALHPLDLEIHPGEMVVLVGPSGCGKTTALRMIAGLEEPTSGTVVIGGRDVTDVEPAERDIAMVFQNYALYPHMTVAENLTFGLRMQRMPRAEIASRLQRTAAVLGLEALLDRRPGQLSGGQRQRVALGRAIVRDPRVFLFDEPLSNLDATLRTEMRQEIATLHRRLGATTILVTHDQVEAMTLGARIAVLRDGRLQQFAPPLEVYRSPANLFVATFIGTPRINTLRGEVAGGQFQSAGMRVPVGRSPRDGPAVLAIRPEDLTLLDAADPAADVAVGVDRLEPLGNELLVHVCCQPDLRWIVRTRPDWSGVAGARAGLQLTRSRIHLFDPSTESHL